MKVFSSLRTYKKLGLRNCAAVAFYRLLLRAGFYERQLPLRRCPIPEPLNCEPELASIASMAVSLLPTPCWREKLLGLVITFFRLLLLRIGSLIHSLLSISISLSTGAVAAPFNMLISSGAGARWGAVVDSCLAPKATTATAMPLTAVRVGASPTP